MIRAAIRLVIFDVDGTLAESFTLNLLPHVQEFFGLVLSGACPDSPKIALATNQGGVGMRYWMEQGGFGAPAKYPTEAKIETRLRDLLQALGADPRVPVYMSYRYLNRDGTWTPVPPGKETDVRWSQDWRKPSPGMLRQAMADAGVTPSETLFVGDSSDDKGAAQAAGCAFQWAGDFFARPWTDCEDLSARMNNAHKTEGP